MIATLIDTVTDGNWRRAARGAGWRGRIAAARAAYREHASENRADKDVAAIAAALSRLSSRRLALIGVRHDGLLHDVATLIDRRRQSLQETDEILAIVDGSPAERRRHDEVNPADHLPLHPRAVSADRQAA